MLVGMWSISFIVFSTSTISNVITTDDEPKPSHHVQCALGVDRDGNTHYCCSVAVMRRGVVHLYL